MSMHHGFVPGDSVVLGSLVIERVYYSNCCLNCYLLNAKK